eukprot:889997-Pleurochrysis_carterae.AAC.1
MSDTVAPPLSLVPVWRRGEGQEGCRGRCSAKSNTTGCSLSLARAGGSFEKMRAKIDGAVGKHAEVRNVGVVGLPGSVG